MFGQGGQNNKVICRFYQRGDCKYGNNCYNIHQGVLGSPKTNMFGGSSSSNLGFSSYDNNNNNNGSNNGLQDNQFMEFVKQVTHEMKIWETNGLWPLSCLAPLKEHPLIAEFHDTSPEELRVEAYEALKMNNSAAYEASYRQKLEYHKQLCEAIKNRNPSAIEALKSVFYVSGTNNSTPSSNTSSIFGKSSSTFLGNTSQPSVFGGSSNNTNKTTSVFGGSANLGANNIFGAKPTQNSVFGGAPIFGSSTSTSFGGGNTFKSTFGSGSSLFGGAANQSTTQNVFGTSSQGSIFGSGSVQQPQQTSSGSIFGTNTTSNSAGSNQNSNVFGTGTQNNSSNVFGGNTQQASGFGSGGQFGGSSSGFGNQSIFNKNQSSSIFGNNSQGNVGSSLFSTPAKDNQSNVFGVQSSGTNTAKIFGGSSNSNDQQQQQQQQHQQQSPLNLSAGSSSIFGANFENKTANGIFNNSTVDKTSGIFGTSVSSSENSSFSYGLNKSLNVGNTTQASSGGNSIFGGNSTSNNPNPVSLFGTPKPLEKEELSQQTSVVRSIFGNNQKNTASTLFDNDQKDTTNTLFGSDQKNTMHTLFGSDQKSSTNTLFGIGHKTTNTNAEEASKIYTPLSLLSLEDKNEFERDVFQRIPIVPPPKELCF